MRFARFVLLGVVAGLATAASAQTLTPSVNPLTAVSVDVLHANPGGFQNETVALSGIERVTQTEVVEGRYQLSIYGHGEAACLQAILPFKWAVLAVRSHTLYVSVRDAKANPPTLTIYGNALAAAAAPARPKILWTEPTP